MPYQRTLLVVLGSTVAVPHLSCLLCITITQTDRRKTKVNENIEILQRQFDVYCTKVLKYASISFYQLLPCQPPHGAWSVLFFPTGKGFSRGQHHRPLSLYALPFPCEGMACRSAERTVRIRHRATYPVQTGNYLAVLFLRLQKQRDCHPLWL